MKRTPLILFSAMILAAAGLLVSASPLQVPSGSWIATGAMNSARSGAAAVLLQDGRILITGGNGANGPANSAELFGSNGSFSLASPMNVPRSGHVAVVLQDGRVLVAGGLTSGGAVTNTAEIFDPVASTWTSVTGGMLEARSGHTAALLHDGRVAIAGGNNGTLISSTVEIFTPTQSRFSAVGTMSSPRTEHAMTVLQDGRVLIVGGNNGTAPVASSDIFDPVAGRISAGPNLSVARFAHSATTLLNGIVVVIGGNNGNANPAQMDVTPAELFDPTAPTPAFTTLSSNLASPREGHLAFLLPNNNNVLIVGGTSGGAPVASAELFLPEESSTGVWTYVFGATGSMSTARSSASGAANQVSSPSSVMQANGMLLVAGGSGASGNTLNSAELYGFATIQTDHGDYPPGQTVTMTGSGWKPGETVTLTLVESPLIDTGSPFTAVADANGNITDTSFTTDYHDVNVKFTLTAVGSVSRAQMTFTDSPNFIISGAVNDDVTGVGIAGATVSFYQSSSATCTSPTAWTPASTTTASGGTYTATGTGNITTLCAAVTAPANYTASGAVAGTGSTVVNSSEISTPDGSSGGTSTGNNFFVHSTAAVETIAAANASIPYSASAQNVPLTATVTSTDGTVNTGSVSFTVKNGATVIGTATSGNVTSGSASVNYALPAQTAAQSYTIQASYNTGSGNSDVTDSSHQLTVSAAALTVTGITVNSKVYNGTTTATLNTASAALVGVGSPDTVTLNASSYTANFSDKNVANGKAVTVTGLGLGGASAANYTLTQPTGLTGNITPAALTITAINRTKTFGQTVTFAGTEFTTSGLISPDTVTSVTLTSAGAAATATVAGSPYSIVPSAAVGSGLTNYTITYVNGTLTVIPALAFVRSAGASTRSGAFTVTISPTAGDFLAVVVMQIEGGVDPTVMTDNKASVYTKDCDLTYNQGFGAGRRMTVYHLQNAPSGITTVDITVNIDARAIVAEYSGMPSSGTVLDVCGTVNNQTTGVTSWTSPATTTTANDVVLGIAETGYTANAGYAAGTGWTGRQEQSNPPDGDDSYLEDKVGVAAGSYTATGTTTASAGESTVIVAYKATPPTIAPTITSTNSAAFAVGTAGTFTVTATGTPAPTLSETGALPTGVTFTAATGILAGTPAAGTVGTYPITITAQNGITPNAAQNFTLTVSSAALTYTANPASRVYGAANPTFSGTVTGFIAPDTQANSTTGTLTFSSNATASSNVGSYAIDGSGLTSNNGKYAFVQAASNATALTITPATPAVTVTGGTFTYNGSSHAATATAVGTDGITAVSGSFTFTYSPPGNSTIPVNPGTYSVTASFTSSNPNYGNATGLGSIIILPGPPSLYQSQSSDVSNTASTAFSKTTQSGDLIVGFAGTQLLGSQVTGSFTASPVAVSDGTAMIQCSPAPCNYTTTDGYLNTRLWAGKSAGGTKPTITFNTTSPGQSIGGYAFELAEANTLDQVATSQTLSSKAATLTSSTITTKFANEIILCLAQEANPIDGGNHFTGLNSASSTWTGVAFGNQAIAYLVTSATGNYSCTFNLGSGVAEDYAITIASFYYANTAIAASNASATYSASAQNVPLTATVTGTSGTVNSGTVTFTILSGATTIGTATTGNVTSGSASVNYALPAQTAAKSYTIQATYTPTSGSTVTDSTHQLTVTPATLTVTGITANNKPYDGTTTATLNTASAALVGVGSGDTVTLSTSSYTANFSDKNVANAKTVTVTGLTLSGASAANYMLTQPSGLTANITPATLTYTATPASRNFGVANPTFTGTVTGFIAPDTLTTATTGTLAFTSSATATSNVGSYPINGSGLSATNYTFVQAGANATALTVNPATLTYTATPASRSYGSPNPAFTGTVTGFVAPDTQTTATTGTLAFTSTATPSSSVGSYPINGSGLSANTSNYVFAQAAANATALTITPAGTLTYQANPVSRSYGSANPTFSGTVTGFIGNDNQANSTTGTLTFSSTATAASNAGSYAINGSGLSSTNYTFVQSPANVSALTVTPATLTYTATAASRNFGVANPTFAGTVTGFIAPDTLTTATTGTLAFTSSATATSNVGSYPINGSGLSATNYTFVQAAANATALTVNPASLTYTATPASRSYGSPNPTFTGTVTGFVAPDTQTTATSGTLAFTSTATATSSVGSYPINGSGLSANTSNYVFAQAAANATALTITPAGTLTYQANPVSRSYGSANPTFSGTVTGFIGNDNQANSTTGTLTFSSTATAASNAGSYAINGSGLSSTNYTFVQSPANATALTVTPATLTYTATPASRNFGVANPTFAGTVTGFIAPDTLTTATTGTLAFTSSATATSNVGSYPINGSGLSATNYTFVQAAANATALTVNPASLTYTATPASRSYGIANPTFSGTVSGFIAPDTQATATTGTLAFTSTATATSSVGSYPINGSGLTANTSNYVFVQAAANATALTITPAGTLTYQANPVSRSYGTANPTFSGTVTGFIGNDNQANSTTGTLTFSSTATASSSAGSYAINGSGLSSTNYTFVQSPANATALTVTPATLTYTATAASRNFGSANPTFSGTVTGFIAPDTLTTATTGTLAFTSSATATSNVGSYPINGSGLSATNYTFVQAAANATALTVNPATLTYTATPASRSYGIANPTFSGTVSGFIAPDTQATATSGTLAFTSTATATSSVGSYPINGSGLTANTSNYVFVQAAANATALTITPAGTLTYQANPVSRSYGTANPTFSGTVTGFIGNDNQANSTTGTLTFSSTATAASNAGSYAINGSGLSSTNYTFVQSPANATALTVTPATLTYTATAASRNFGVANPAFTGTVTGFIAPDTLTTATTGTLAFTSSATATSNVGSYPINGSGLSATNYTFVQAAANATALTVNPASLTYTATPASRSYGIANPTFSGTVSGFIAPDTQATATSGTLAFTSTATATSSVGSYPINGSGLTANTANYVFVQAAANATALTITPAGTLTYQANPVSRSYGTANPTFSGTVTGFIGNDNQANSTTGTLAFTSTATASSSAGSYAINGSGLSSTNYTFVQSPANATALTVTPATLTYTATPASRNFGVANPTFAGTVTGFIAPDTLTTATTGTLAFTSSATATSNVGSYPINGSGLSATNYTFVQAAANATALTINPASLTYTATPASRSYGIANPTFSGTVSGFIAPDTQATATTGTLAFTSTATATSSVGSYPINGSGLTANTSNYVFVQAAANATALTITPAGTLTYQANPVSRSYGTANPTFSGTVTGFIGNDNQANSTTGTLTFSSTATASSSAGSYAINGSGLSSTNYTFVQSPANATALTVTPATLTYTATAASRNFGSANPTFSGTVTGFIAPDTLTTATTGTLAFTSSATATSNVGSYPINGSGLSATNYTFVQAAANATALTIAKASPTITVTGGTFPYTGSSYAATATAVGVDGVTPVSGTFSFTYTPPGNSTAPINVGTYAITASFTSTNSNYSNATGSGSITITGSASSTVTLNNANTPVAAFNASSFSKPMTVTAGGTNTVAFATVWVDEGSGASGTTFNVTATYGGQAMTSAGATAYDYDYAPISSQVFYLVNPPTGTNTLVVNATASSGTIQEVVANLVSYNGVNQTTPVRPGTYQTLNSLNGATVGGFSATLASNTNDLTLGAVEATYAFATPASNQTVDGTASAYFRVGSDHATAGASSISDTWSFTNPYAFYAYVGFSIQAASGGSTPTLTYTATPASQTYGSANPAYTGTVTGFIGSDTQANATTGTLTFTSTATPSSNVGTYPITGSGLTANGGKYVFAQAASNATALTITPATPTITVTGGTFAYSGNSYSATATAVGVDGVTPVSGTFSFTYTPPGNSTAPINAGTYTVTASFTSTNPNYSNATGTGSITITSFGSTNVTLNNTNTPATAFNSSSLSKAMTVNAGGSNTVAFATVWVDEGSGASGTTFNVTATYGGQTMTSAGATAYDYDYAPISCQVFYLINPPTGTNTLAINATASSGTIQEVVANLVSFNGVNQTTPVRPGTYQTLNSLNGATVGSFTATISSSATDLTLGALEATYVFASPASNQTVDGTASSYFRVGNDHATTGAPSISDTWSFTNPYAFYAYVGFSIQSAGTPPILTYTANPASRVAGTANPTFTGTVTGFIGSDTLASSTTGTLTFTSPATTASGPGSYAINGSGLTANNGKYTFVQAPSNSTALTVTPSGCVGGSPSNYQYELDDISNTASSPFPNTTKNCDMIVAFASTQLNLASFTGTPTISDGTPMPQCALAACNFTTSNNSMNTRIWTGVSTGGTTPTLTYNLSASGQTIGGVAVELSGVTTLDQVITSQLLSDSSTSITSPSITTTHPNEILLCLDSEANPIAGGAHFIGVNSPFTLITFGNQAIGYYVATTPGTYSCTATRAAGIQDETLTIAGFY